MVWKYKAQQNESELREYVNLLKAAEIRSYLEIGCKWGGTLFRVAQTMPKGSKIVAVDMPTPGSGTEVSLRACVDELERMGHDVLLYLGDSTREDIVSTVRQHGPYDACLIDANHTLPYIEKDYSNYAPVSNIVALHDISYNHKTPDGRMPIEVPIFWKRVKDHYRHVEIRHEPADNGFGILYRNEPTK